MDVFEAMSELRAMRRLKPEPIPPELIREIVEYASFAPSGSNAQGWRFVVVTDPEKRRQIGGYYQQAVAIYFASFNTGPLPHQSQEEWERLKKAVVWQGEHLAEVPVLIFPCLANVGRGDFSSTMIHSSLNGSIWPACQNILLACRAHGLGATVTTLHLLFEQPVNEILGLPATARSFAMLPIGYPMGKFGPVKRVPVENVLAWNSWENVGAPVS